jgi:hypothetical protein
VTGAGFGVSHVLLTENELVSWLVGWLVGLLVSQSLGHSVSQLPVTLLTTAVFAGAFGVKLFQR